MSDARNRTDSDETPVPASSGQEFDDEIPDDLEFDPGRAKRVLDLVRRARPSDVSPLCDAEEVAWLDVVREEARLRAALGVREELTDWKRAIPEFVPRLNGLPLESSPSPYPLRPHFEPLPAIPGYEIVEEIGKGGMGVVYRARQTRLSRWVALKMLPAGRDDPNLIARQRREAEILARLRHPNIVQVHEIGEVGGRSYIVLEYVSGGSLDRRLGGEPLAPAVAAELVEILTRAVQSAHDNGVIHRDLKPGNVLLAPIGNERGGFEKNDRLLSTYLLKIGDFGLAKSLTIEGDRAAEPLTHSGIIAGTPSYMAPEQARGDSAEVGPSADIYALGSILYELLTGRPPFRAASAVETLMLVMNEDPIPPGRLQPRLPRDLETICLKCLAKRPSDRYSSALSLAEDLNRWRDGKSILARPSPTWERIWKWSRRRPAAAALAIVAAILMSTAPALSVWASYTDRLRNSLHQTRVSHRNETAARVRAERAEQSAREIDYFHRVLLAGVEWRDARLGRAKQLLDEISPELRGWEWGYMSRVCGPSDMKLDHPAELYCAAVSPDGRSIVSGGRDNAARLWSADTGIPLGTLQGHTQRIYGVSFSPDSAKVATASSDGSVKIWSVADRRLLTDFKKHGASVRSAVFSPDGRLVASAGKDLRVRLWRPESGESVRDLEGEQGQDHSIAFRPDGRLLAYGGGTYVRLYDPDSGALIRKIGPTTSYVRAVSFHPKRNALVVATENGDLTVWNLDAPLGTEPERIIRGHADKVYSAAWSPDGARIASGGMDTTARVWSADTGAEIRRLQGHEGRIYSVAWNPVNGRLVTAATDKIVRSWDLDASSEAMRVKADGPVRCLSWTPDGRKLVGVIKSPPRLAIWDAASGKPIASAPTGDLAIICAAISPSGREIALGSSTGSFRLWDLKRRAPIAEYSSKGSSVLVVEFDADGRHVAAGRADKSIEVREIATGARIDPARGPDAPRFGAFTADRLMQILPEAALVTRGLAWSPDGRFVASPVVEAEVCVWDDRKNLVNRLRGHTHGINMVSWSRDGTRLASAGSDRVVRVWEPLSGQAALTLGGFRSDVLSVAWSSDSRRLAAGDSQGTILIWDGGHESPR